MSFATFLISIIGLAIIWMYGLCLTEDSECSYDNSVKQNKTMALLLFSFGVVGFASAAVGVGLIRSFGLAFGLVTVEGRNGMLRYTGYHRDVMREIRRQNEAVRQERDSQAPYPNIPPGLQGIANFGFEPPSPPPYSPNAMEVSAVSNGQLSVIQNGSISSEIITTDPPKYSDIELAVITTDLPPPYTETAESSTGNSGETNTKL